MTFVLAAGAALIPAQASAQELKGSFDLPMKTQWSQMTLVPGHYTISLERMQSGMKMLRLKGPEGSQVKPVFVSNFIKETDTNYLRLERIGTSYVVREFHCGSVGQAFNFHVPKQLASEEARNERHNAQETVVALNSIAH
jgi:hypothetical protein